MIVGFIDKNSLLRKYYERKRNKSRFYKSANYYSVEEVEEKMKAEGLKVPEIFQTLFNDPDNTNNTELLVTGSGKGSYILIKATK